MKVYIPRARVLLMFLIIGKACESKVTNLFWCSYKQSTPLTITVATDTIYFVDLDKTPQGEVPKNCQLNFEAGQNDGKLCVGRDLLRNTINVSGIVLMASNTSSFKKKDKLLFDVRYYPDDWGEGVEECFQNKINFKLKGIKANTDLKKFRLQFKVFDTQNQRRIYYIDGKYGLGPMIFLHNSQVNVINTLPPGWPADPWISDKGKSTRGFVPSYMEFEKVKGSSTKICFVYIPMENVGCANTNWFLYVDNKRSIDVNVSNADWGFKCDAQDAKSKKYFCGEASKDRYVLYIGGDEPDLVIETTNIFRVVVLDFSGTLDELKAKDFPVPDLTIASTVYIPDIPGITTVVPQATTKPSYSKVSTVKQTEWVQDGETNDTNREDKEDTDDTGAADDVDSVSVTLSSVVVAVVTLSVMAAGVVYVKKICASPDNRRITEGRKTEAVSSTTSSDDKE